MDDDPDGDDNGVEAGAVEDHDDVSYGSKKAPRKKKNSLSEAEQIEYDNMTPCNLSAEDPANFLKLCRAIQILIRREIVETDLQTADTLIREYCSELVHVSFQFSAFNLITNVHLSCTAPLSYVPIIIIVFIQPNQFAISAHCMNFGLSSSNV